MIKFIMLCLIQLVNLWDMVTTYLFYLKAWPHFMEISPFYRYVWHNIYFFLLLKFTVILIISIWIYKLFSEKYFFVLYTTLLFLYVYAITNNYHVMKSFEITLNLQ